MIKRILKSWVGPNLPKQHLFWEASRPSSLMSRLRYYLLQLTYHPKKRWLAKWWLMLLRRLCGLQVIAITGSAGKTTTKEMILSVLSLRYHVVGSRENIDPVYNIPATILRCRPWTKYIVLEMGVEYPGEMDFYLWLSGPPDSGILTSLGETHTEFFGSLGGVWQEKRKMLEGVSPSGVVIINADCLERVDDLLRLKSSPIITYSAQEQSKSNGGADYVASEINLSLSGATHFHLQIDDEDMGVWELPLLGQHYVSNALAAMAVGRECRVSLDMVRKGLMAMSPAPHRLQPVHLSNGTVILDDTYNSNPLAVKEALKVLTEVAKEKSTIAVLGEMKELGSLSESRHREMGHMVADLGVDYLIGYLDGSRLIVEGAREKGLERSEVVSSDNNLVTRLKDIMRGNEVILVKGSHSLKMDEIVEGLKKEYA